MNLLDFDGALIRQRNEALLREVQTNRRAKRLGKNRRTNLRQRYLGSFWDKLKSVGALGLVERLVGTPIHRVEGGE